MSSLPVSWHPFIPCYTIKSLLWILILVCFYHSQPVGSLLQPESCLDCSARLFPVPWHALLLFTTSPWPSQSLPQHSTSPDSLCRPFQTLEPLSGRFDPLQKDFPVGLLDRASLEPQTTPSRHRILYQIPSKSLWSPFPDVDAASLDAHLFVSSCCLSLLPYRAASFHQITFFLVFFGLLFSSLSFVFFQSVKFSSFHGVLSSLIVFFIYYLLRLFSFLLSFKETKLYSPLSWVAYQDSCVASGVSAPISLTLPFYCLRLSWLPFS